MANKSITLQDSQGNSIFPSIYPVGSIYMSINNTDPGTLFGGTWQRIQNRFLLAASDTYPVKSEGGEATHVLTKDEMPAHTHTRGTMNIIGEFRAHSEYNYKNTDFANRLKGPFWYNTDDTENWGSSTNFSPGTNDTTRQIHFDASRAWTGETSSVGNNKAHNNMPPYISVYMWIRIS